MFFLGPNILVRKQPFLGYHGNRSSFLKKCYAHFAGSPITNELWKKSDQIGIRFSLKNCCKPDPLLYVSMATGPSLGVLNCESLYFSIVHVIYYQNKWQVCSIHQIVKVCTFLLFMLYTTRINDKFCSIHLSAFNFGLTWLFGYFGCMDHPQLQFIFDSW